MNNRQKSDFEWVENYLEAPVPAIFRKLHEGGEARDLANLIVDQSDDSGEGLYFCISHWTTQNAESYNSDKIYGHPRLLLTRDHSGNICYSQKEDNFTNVFYFNHETRDSESLDITLSEFIELTRQAKLDDE